MRQDRATIDTISGDGGLFDYRRRYYQFQRDQVDAESAAMAKIGDLADAPMPFGKALYLRYHTLRASGQSRETIERNGFRPNYGMTFDSGEDLVLKLASTPEGRAIRNQIDVFGRLHNDAAILMGRFR